MSASLALKRQLRAQARATGEARVGACVVATMATRHEPNTKLSRNDLRARIRVLEIEKLIRARHGAVVPDARDTHDLPAALAYLTAAAGGRADIDSWARRWLPWLDDPKVLQAARTLADKLTNSKRGPCILPADDVAKLLGVTLAERERLRLNTIGACDLPRAQRLQEAAARKRNADRERQAEKRRKAGARPRADEIAVSISATRPWEAEGISRATWYRRQRETTASRVIEKTYAGDAAVSAQLGCMEPCMAAASILSPDPATAPPIAEREHGFRFGTEVNEENEASAKRARGSGASPPAGVSRGAGPAGAIHEPVSSTEVRRTAHG